MIDKPLNKTQTIDIRRLTMWIKTKSVFTKSYTRICLLTALSSLAWGWSQGPSSSLLEIQKSFNQIAKQCVPAVVSVTAEQTSDPLAFQFPYRDFMERLFPFFSPERRNEDPDSQRQRSTETRRIPVFGSGFFISSDGYLISNHHVVEGAKNIFVKLHNREKKHKAKIIGVDRETDLALLKIEGKDFPYLSFSNSDQIEIGDLVIAIGSPFQLSSTFTMGVISAKGRSGIAGAPTYQNFIQTDVAINPGNSGGPLIDIYGRVVGINTMIASTTGGNLGIGFAIPANMADKVIDQLKKKGKVTRGWLGVVIENMDQETQEDLDLKQRGVYILHVEKDSPAEKAGIRPADVIVHYNGKRTETAGDLMKHVAETSPGATVSVEFYRKKRRHEVSIKVNERKYSLSSSEKKNRDSTKYDQLGLLVEATGKEERTKGIKIISISSDSPLAAKGVSRGDVIQMINYEDLKSINDYERIVKNLRNGEKVILHINQQGYLRPIAIRMETS